MASLKIASGSLAGQTIELAHEQNLVGRSSQNDIRVGDAGVSSRHAKIFREEGRWFALDLGSTNGTLLNGAVIRREPLSDGDKITFGTVVAVFVGDPQADTLPPPGPDARVADMEADLASLQRRNRALEEESERARAEAVENEKRAGEAAVHTLRAEMEKLRDLMRERDDTMRLMEQRIHERETWFSPEELERERRRVEAQVGADAKRKLDALERQVRDLEAKVSARTAEVEASQRSQREKDELIRLLSEREDRAGATLREKDDALAEAATKVRGLEDEFAASASREREAADKLRQKNVQLAELGQQQAVLVQEIAKVRALAARVQAGDAPGAAEQAEAAAREVSQLKTQALALRTRVHELEDALVGAEKTRDREAEKSAAILRQTEELQGQVTDLSDEKSHLEARVGELLERHAALAAMERELAGARADAAESRASAEAARLAAEQADAEAVAARKAVLDAEARSQEMRLEHVKLQEDYRVMKVSRDEAFDWEARFKSQVDEFDAMRRENAESRAAIEALEAQLARAPQGGADAAELVLAQSRAAVLDELAAGLLEGVNSAVSVLRRNAEVLKGYVHDCGLLANCVRQIDYTRLEPSQQRMLRELVDETQPDIIIRNMEGIGVEDAEATASGKRLILDYQESMRRSEDPTGLERCFERGLGLSQAGDTMPVRVKFAKALPPLAPQQPDTVLFCYALLREAKAMAVDEEQAPVVRVDADGRTLTMIVTPLHAKVKDRWAETLDGGGDARSRYILEFVRRLCEGRVDAKDMGEAAALFITLQAAKDER